MSVHPFPAPLFLLHTILIYFIYGIAVNDQLSHAFHLLFYYMRKFWIGPHIYYRKKEKGDLMSEHTFPAMTPVDALVSDDSLQAIKACIPFFDLSEQPALLAFAKFMEFRKSLQLAREQKDALAACSIEPSMRTPAHMLNAIKEYCTQEQRRSIESLMNAMQMLQLIQMFQMPSPGMRPGLLPRIPWSCSPACSLMTRKICSVSFRKRCSSKTLPPSRKSQQEVIAVAQPQMPWLDDPALADIEPEKLQMLIQLYQQAEGKSMQEALPFLLGAAARMKQNGTAFSHAEFQVIFEALKAGKSPEEIRRMNRLIRLFSGMQR